MFDLSKFNTREDFINFAVGKSWIDLHNNTEHFFTNKGFYRFENIHILIDSLGRRYAVIDYKHTTKRLEYIFPEGWDLANSPTTDFILED